MAFRFKDNVWSHQNFEYENIHEYNHLQAAMYTIQEKIIFANYSTENSLDFNATTPPVDDNLYRHEADFITFMIIGYSLIAFAGAIGNSLVIAVIRNNPRLQTVTNYFIVNLAIADMLMLCICVPSTLVANIFVAWELGYALCKLTTYIHGVTVCVSVYSLVAISIERLLAIRFSARHRLTKKKARIIICLIWLWSLILYFPWFLFFDLSFADDEQPDVVFCVEIWPQWINKNIYYLVANLILCYVIPLVIMFICYGLIWKKLSAWQGPIPTVFSTSSTPATLLELQPYAIATRRAGEPQEGRSPQQNIPSSRDPTRTQSQPTRIAILKMLLIVVTCFAIAWLPLYTLFTWINFGEPMSAVGEKIINVVAPLCQLFGAANSAINPVLYSFFSARFRRALFKLLKNRRESIIRRARAHFE